MTRQTQDMPVTTKARHQTALERLGTATEAEGRGDALPAIAMPMHMGLDGLLTGIEGDAGAQIVKTYHDGSLYPFGFAEASRATRHAGAAGLGPAVVAVQEETRSLITMQFGAPWRMASAKDFLDPAMLAALVDAKKDWHEAGFAAPELSPAEEFEALLARWRSRDAAPLPVTIRMDDTGIAQWITRILEALSRVTEAPVPLHGENTLSNVLTDDQGNIRLLDFDRCVMGDAFRDLGALAHEVCVDDDDRARLIAAYAGAPATASQMARLKLWGLYDDALWAFWALIGETEADRRGPELYKYAANRLVRFRLHLSVFDMARLLREV
ncbi:aminoglycoside phosphotransferase family protein [Pseudooceanicola sp. CBS1P-1]|uniref:Phosphotransferase n=1 Tax=Pseudooceanicola albus TaxID=2692189 RepID=A0A6L7G5T7_9RHOB|nr:MULTISPECIES: phosphotransferase [Pseudooceanicola]MBT9385293.1 aminoglycoside phosphotransferase family protein [Pseudooceanicola endophyticus]MXN18848.1 phosphotransferase [Pseudooceanicola albus]